MLAPAAVPPALVAKIHDDLAAVLARADIQERMKAQGIEPPPPMSIAQFVEFIRSEAAYWDTATRRLGLYRLE